VQRKPTVTRPLLVSYAAYVIERTVSLRLTAGSRIRHNYDRGCPAEDCRILMCAILS